MATFRKNIIRSGKTVLTLTYETGTNGRSILMLITSYDKSPLLTSAVIAQSESDEDIKAATLLAAEQLALASGLNVNMPLSEMLEIVANNIQVKIIE